MDKQFFHPKAQVQVSSFRILEEKLQTALPANSKTNLGGQSKLDFFNMPKI